jgi:sugar phosphate isomerase/epimerase
VVEYAQALHCDLVHVMAGVVSEATDPAQAERTYIENLRHAAGFLKAYGVRVVIEPLNRKLGIVQGGASSRWSPSLNFLYNRPSSVPFEQIAVTTL